MSDDIKTNSAYNHPNENPDNFLKWKPENFKAYKEAVYNRISILLIENISTIEQYIDGGINSLQKTYKDGLLVSGKKESDMLVVYEDDSEIGDNRYIEDALFNWLDFEELDQLTLTIEPTITTDDGEDNVGAKPQPDFILHLPDRDFNINQVLGTLNNIDSVSLKENLSQFMDINPIKTAIDRSKMTEYLDTDFSELTPITFTHLLESYNRLKKSIPFYRFRTEDFFTEYNIETY